MKFTEEELKAIDSEKTSMEAEKGIIDVEVVPPENNLIGIEWARRFYPHLFSRPFAFYQKEFWEWIDLIEPKRNYRPRVECEPRGVGKSTNSEVAAVKLIATKKRKMGGYVSLDDTKATKHFDSIKNLMESEQLLSVYPHCRPKIQKLQNKAAQWSKDAIVTQSGAMLVPLTLLGSSRGWKSAEGLRFDFLVLDDIDKLGQSNSVILKMLELLKGEILAAGDDNTVIWMPQNLIHRDSICTMVLDHRADILSDRIFCGPYPLLKKYDAEKIDLPDGAKKWVITSGEAFDKAIPLEYAESLLNKYGKALFDRECQQDVYKVEDDKDFREWNELYHVITYSEFVEYFSGYGVNVWNDSRRHPQIPHNWNVGLGLDWGTTVGHPSACAPVARPNQLSPLNDCFFAFTEIILPKYPLNVGEEVPLVSPGRVAQAIKEGLAEWNVTDSQIQIKLMSHEASAALNTMAVDLKPELKEYFGKWQAKKGSGVPQIQQLLEIDYRQKHPFRSFLEGKPRFFLVVPDEQGKVTTDILGNYIIGQPTDYKGLARARFEFPIYSHKNSGQNKTNDDYMDGLRGLMNMFGVSSQPPTIQEEFNELMKDSPELKRDESGQFNLSFQEQQRLTHQRFIAENRLKEKYGDDVFEEETEGSNWWD